MGKLDLTSDEIKQLIAMHKFTHNNSMKENRIRIILSYNDDKSKEELKNTFLLDYQTIRRYINDFNQFRMDSIDFEDRRRTKSGNTSTLNEQQINDVKDYLQNNFVTEAIQIKDYIKSKFNLEYSLSGTTSLLHRLNFAYKKVVTIPQKANTPESTEKQLDFEQKYNHLKEDLNNDDKTFFLDGVHPTHNTKADYAWIEIGKEKIIETNSGRERVNINGAYDTNSGDVIVTNSKTINSDSTLELFDAIIKANDETDGVLYCISDNARYYKSYLIQDALKTEQYKRIKMIFLPPYSPNLNPIERVWKYFKKKVLNNQFYKTVKEFKEAIDYFFNTVIKSKTIKEKLKKFASDNFHIRNRETLSLIYPVSDFSYNYFGNKK